MTAELSKRQLMKSFFATHDGEATIHFNGEQKTGNPLAAENGLYLEWKISDGMQEKRGSTFILYEDIAGVSY